MKNHYYETHALIIFGNHIDKAVAAVGRNPDKEYNRVQGMDYCWICKTQKEALQLKDKLKQAIGNISGVHVNVFKSPHVYSTTSIAKQLPQVKSHA